MPEYEESTPRKDPGSHYSPSTDASAKSKSRRRSGGFKSQTAADKNAGPGEIDPKEALKSEKLSGPTSGAKAGKGGNASAATHRDSDASAPPRNKRNPSEAKGANPRSAKGKPRKHANSEEPPEHRDRESEANPKAPAPADATLEAIRNVEARIADRRAQREAKRKSPKLRDAGRDGEVPRPGGAAHNTRHGRGASGPINALARFFRKLFGGGEAPPSAGGPPPHSGGSRSGKNGAKSSASRGGNARNRGSGGRKGSRDRADDRSGRGGGGRRRSGESRQRHSAKPDSRPHS